MVIQKAVINKTSRLVDHCRICSSSDLRRYLDLGAMPLANSYLTGDQLEKEEFKESLCLQLCQSCGLSQLTSVVHPDKMFRHYLYVSSTTMTMTEHFSELAVTAAQIAAANKEELVLDIASNDGCLLRAFQKLGMKVLGVDPAQNLAAEANASGVPTKNAYWSEALALDISHQYGRAKIITAANVFAHVDDLQDFMRGIAAALSPDGIFIIECPYVVDFIEKAEFDTAYHEHISYFGVTPMEILMNNHGFSIFDIQYFPDIHGGLIRVFVGNVIRRRARSDQAEKFFYRENKFRISKPDVYDRFAKKVIENKRSLLNILGELMALGKNIWAYGASAKGNTLMNFYELTAEQIPIVIDDNPKKLGLYTPGAHMKIKGISALSEAKVDYLLLLAWNFEKEIRDRCCAAGYQGGFILPVPEPRVFPGQHSSRGG